MSKKKAKTPIIKPYIIEEEILKFIKSLIKKDITIINNKPIIVPSMVLPLLILGIILFLPNNLPPKYANISITLTKITTYKIIDKPLGCCKMLIKEKKESIIRFDKIVFI